MTKITRCSKDRSLKSQLELLKSKVRSFAQNDALHLPKHLLLFCVMTTELIPFLSRLPNIPIRGWEWFTDYFPGISGILFFAALNLVPGCALYVLGKLSKRMPLAFWFAFAAGTGFLLWAHGSVNLRSSSTAAIALIFIPVYGAVAVAIGWIIGFIAHIIVRTDRGRAWSAGIVCVIAILLGAGIGVYESVTITRREARFPVITVNELSLSKREVLPCRSVGSVKVFAYNNFDVEPGNEIAVVGTLGIALLNPLEYTIKLKSDFGSDTGNECIHVFSDIIPDGKGTFLLSSDDDVADQRGHLLWKLKSSSFTHLVPIGGAKQEPSFFASHIYDRVELHEVDGNVLWDIKLGVSEIGVYITLDGERLVFALTGQEKGQEIKLYNLNGELRKTVRIPNWVLNVEEIAWPTRGHWLVGRGSRIGVLNPEGNEVFKSVIRDTSFNPYHGPNGTAVRFDPLQEPYLAIMSHGSSGYDRSVLLIFNPEGRLVWQEETNKLRAILAVPQDDNNGEILLVGGMDGVIEYRLSK